MKKLFFLVYLVVLGIFFSGCGTAIKLNEFQKQSLQKSKYMPSPDEIKDTTLPKVIFFDIENDRFELAKRANLGKSLTTSIKQNLSQAKTVNILKRLSNKSLSEEIKAAELAREVNTDVGQADYVITGELSDVTYNYEFNEGYYYYVETKEGKKKIYSPPYINYRSCVSGSVKILNLPQLYENESVSFSGCATTSHEARSPRDAKRSNSSLVRSAGSNAINYALNPLKNFFSKKGYIYEMRRDGENIIVKTNLGIKYGAREGERVDIYAMQDNYNMLEDKITPSEVLVGEGVISNQLGYDYSWIIVDNVEGDIKAGDYIKIRYGRSYLW